MKIEKFTHRKLQTDIRDSRLLLGAKRLVMDALILRASAKTGWSCSPSYRELAGDTGLHRRTIQRAVDVLARAALIHRECRRNDSNLFISRCKLIQLLAAGMRTKDA